MAKIYSAQTVDKDASHVAATLSTALTGDNNDLTFTAVNAGVQGNLISVEYVDPAAALNASLTLGGGSEEGLVFTAKEVGRGGEAITVAFTNASASEYFTVTTDQTAEDADLIFTAKVAGVQPTVEYVDPAGVSQALAVSNVDNAITVSLATDETGEITTTAADILAAIEADVGGANDIVTVELPEDATGAGVVEAAEYTLVVDGGTATTCSTSTAAITVLVGTDEDGVIDATAQDVLNAFSGDNAAKALVTVALVEGDDGTGVVTAHTAANLVCTASAEEAVTVTGNAISVSLGTSAAGAIDTLASAVDSAIDGEADAAALVTPANKAANDGSGVVTAMAATFLSGGISNNTPVNIVETELVGGNEYQFVAKITAGLTAPTATHISMGHACIPTNETADATLVARLKASGLAIFDSFALPRAASGVQFTVTAKRPATGKYLITWLDYPQLGADVTLELDAVES